MPRLRNRTPNVKALARAGNVDGLAEAASFQDLLLDRSGTPLDLGVAVREAAILALAEIDSDQANQVIISALGDPADRVRSAAVRALRQRGESAPIAQAMAWLPPGDGAARGLAVRALFELCQPGSAWHLADALVHQRFNDPIDDGDAAVVPALLEAERSPAARGEVINLLIGALASKREVVADRAEALLVRLAPTSVDPLIQELTAGTSPHRAASALGKAKDLRAVQPLMAAVEHPDARIRAESCAALGELRDPAAVEALLRATRDPEHVVRARAGMALDKLGAVAVVLGVSALVQPLIAEAQGNTPELSPPPELADVRGPSAVKPRATRR